MDFLPAGDEAFERAKAQVVCLKSDLNMSEMDFFKTVVDGRLVDMEEASPEAETYKDAMINNPTPDAQEDEQHDV